MRHFKVRVAGGRSVMVRDTDGPDSGESAVMYFHGTPGSRLEPAFGDAISQRLGVRVISFDRPGYGESDSAATTLRIVADDIGAIADAVGVERFATFGWSGGGPFALASAAAHGDRVTRVGVSGGLAPMQEMPGARDALTENDLLALSHLPAEPERAADEFLAGNRELLDGMMSVRDDAAAPWVDWMWADSDPEVVADKDARRSLWVSFREGLRQGPMAIAWDNVAFVGPWGFELADVVSPVHLWYGTRDAMAPQANGEWLAKTLPHAELTLVEGEGHLLPLRHWEEMLQSVTTGD
ncbi:alpha/beta hydrolase [Gordonia sp. zg691]|uniref:alpha/beta fold hydrolase n=1 Tax=Gordonia jinghuaiqii TaxID=2758710 RepID=UPI00166221C0|nr:alpha/beta hydrolase [Gordonia jinghuaiqii]MBD0863983.1 alpha/beta hydrolase [Gordonia jinghuaiqii]